MHHLYRTTRWILRGDQGTATMPDLFETRRIQIGSAEARVSRLVIERLTREVTQVFLHFRLDYLDSSAQLVGRESVGFFVDWMQVQWVPIPHLTVTQAGNYRFTAESQGKLWRFLPQRAVASNQVTALVQQYFFGDPLKVSARAVQLGVALRHDRHAAKELLAFIVQSQLDQLLQTIVVPTWLPPEEVDTPAYVLFTGELKPRFRWERKKGEES